MLRSLARPSLRIILFPCEARFLPAVVDGSDEVLAEFGVEFGGAGFVGVVGGGLGENLWKRGELVTKRGEGWWRRT